MVRRDALATALLVAVACLLGGCSMRHPTLLSPGDLALAAADSVSLDQFLAMPKPVQELRTRRAEGALGPLRTMEAAQFSVDQFLNAPLVHTPYGGYRSLPPLGDVLRHLDAALSLDPSRADLWLMRGRLLDIAGDNRRARTSLETAWMVTDRVPPPEQERRTVRRNIGVAAAWLERDAGWWEAGLAWLDRASSATPRDDSEAILLRGLLLAGRGDLEDAMSLSYGMPPVTVPVVDQLGFEGFLGLKKKKSDLLKRWLQAEVWMRRGRPELAWNVLGKIPYWRRVTVLPHRFYQDLGLYAEASGEVDRANLYYALAFVRREYRRSTFPTPLTCDPVLAGLPHRRANFYRLGSGSFHGGSLVAYAMSSSMLALNRAGSERGEQGYLLASEALETCLRRGIQPDEALAMRGRLRFSRGHYVLAEVDLTEARRVFAERGLVEPWTSYLLGLVAMGRDRPTEAEPMLLESLSADSTRAGAWDALGVARLQLGRRSEARQAFDRALACDPRSHAASFNRGLLRCQEGDLDGGLADFRRAAELDPENTQIARIIQLASLARRDGRPFMPGIDQEGAWKPAAVDVQATPGGVFSPQAAAEAQAQWRFRLGEMFSDVVTETGAQVRADGLDADALAQLVAAHAADPSPANRKVLAHAYVWLEQADEARLLLAPHWGQDLDNDEVLLLLWLDQRAGEDARLRRLARQMGDTVAMEVDRFGWGALVSRILGDDADPLFRGQTTFARFDPSMRFTGRSRAFTEWLSLQELRMASGRGDRDGNMMVDARGRSYAIGRGGAVGAASSGPGAPVGK